MIKVPMKNKKHLVLEIKKFKPIVRALLARGKESSEDDARILLNDILHDALGFDKYTELRTEHREKSNRLDYAVKLNDGKNKNRLDVFDFIIEAKAAHVAISEIHIDQTLNYCLGLNVKYFVVTNANDWRLFFVNKRKKIPEANLVFKFSFSDNHSDEDLAEELYVFSKDCFLSDQWENIKEIKNALDTENIMAVLLSDKVSRIVSKELRELTGVKLDIEIIKSVIEKKLVKEEFQNVNRKLIKKIDEKKTKIIKNESNNLDEVLDLPVLPKDETDNSHVGEVITDTSSILVDEDSDDDISA